MNVQLLSQPCARRVQRDRHVGHGILVICTIHRVLGIRTTRSQSRPRPDAIHLTFDLARELSGAL